MEETSIPIGQYGNVGEKIEIPTVFRLYPRVNRWP